MSAAQFLRTSRRGALLAGASVAISASTESARADTGGATFVRPLLAETVWETPCHVRSSGRPGPSVLVMAGVHGDEPAGVLAAEAVRSWPIERGSMIVIPRVNQPALRVGRRFSPGSRNPDLARCFPRDIHDEPRGELAAALWTILLRFEPDWLLDLHEGWGVHRRDPATLGGTVMHASAPSCRRQAERMVEAVNETIANPRDHFMPVRRFIPGSSVYAASRFLNVASLVQETTRAGRALSLRVGQHETMARRFLSDLGMLGDAL